MTTEDSADFSWVYPGMRTAQTAAEFVQHMGEDQRVEWFKARRGLAPRQDQDCFLQDHAGKLAAAQDALIATGYWPDPDQVGPDLAPRITELGAALRAVTSLAEEFDHLAAWMSEDSHDPQFRAEIYRSEGDRIRSCAGVRTRRGLLRETVGADADAAARERRSIRDWLAELAQEAAHDADHCDRGMRAQLRAKAETLAELLRQLDLREVRSEVQELERRIARQDAPTSERAVRGRLEVFVDRLESAAQQETNRSIGHTYQVVRAQLHRILWGLDPEPLVVFVGPGQDDPVLAAMAAARDAMGLLFTEYRKRLGHA